MSASRVNPALTTIALAALISIAWAGPAKAKQPGSFAIPTSANQLIVVSTPTYHPPNHLATFRAYRRANDTSPWRLVIGPWKAETGYSGLRDHRHEGDGSTPTGVFGIGANFYGNKRNPGGLHYAFHHLSCGDWWDSDPYTPRYNRFIHIRCGITPGFATESDSEGLWTETVAYPYFAVIRFNVDPTIGGRTAPGSAIFLHSWVYGPTAGCVALPEANLLSVLRWLNPKAHPVIAIGTDRELAPDLPAG